MAKRAPTKSIASAEIEFGRTLRDMRRSRDLSQDELGFRSGYHRTYIGQLERGEKSPSLRTLFNLSATLKIKPSEMLKIVEGAVLKAR